jgi:hypothetical protein
LIKVVLISLCFPLNLINDKDTPPLIELYVINYILPLSITMNGIMSSMLGYWHANPTKQKAKNKIK